MRKVASVPAEISPNRYIEKVSLATGEVLPVEIHPRQLLVKYHRDYHPVDVQARRVMSRLVRKTGDDLGPLSEALQGFLSTLREPQTDSLELSGKRVLLVDDDIRNIYAMTALLDELGLVVVAAKDGVEALQAFDREPFDLVLMDMAMPNMDGYTATRMLKGERACAIPVIALTAHAMKGDRDKCITAGCDDYLAKPVGRQELLEMLHRWLAVAQAPRHRVQG